MAYGESFWSSWLRLTLNLIPWLIALQAVWDVATRVWLDKPVAFSLVVKLILFGLVGALVTWKLPAHDLGTGVGHNMLWMLQVIVNVVLWIAVLDRVWSIITTVVAGHPLEWSFVIYTIALGLLAALIGWKWLPPGLFRT